MEEGRGETKNGRPETLTGRQAKTEGQPTARCQMPGAVVSGPWSVDWKRRKTEDRRRKRIPDVGF